MNPRKRFVHFAMWAMMAAAVLVTPIAASAQQNRNSDITQTELRNFDRFLDAHPQIRADLQKNPALVNDSGYLQQHTDLKDFLQSHAGVREELRENPSAFMKAERSYESVRTEGWSNNLICRLPCNTSSRHKPNCSGPNTTKAAIA